MYCNSIIVILVLILSPLFGCVRDYIKSEARPGYYYVVKKGDTLSGIALDKKIGVEELAALNNLEKGELVKEGMALFIPGEATDKENKKGAGQKSTVGNEDATTNITKKKETDKSGDRSGRAIIAKKTDVKKGTKANVPEESLKVKDESKGTIKEKVASKKEVPNEKEKIVVSKSTAPPYRVSEDSTGIMKEVSSQKGNFIWPLKGKVILNYGHQANGMFYNGIRIETNKEATVNASSGGHVIFSALLKDYGETVIIKHENDYATVYTHLSKRLVRVDQRVKRGEKIAVIMPSSNGEAFFDFEIRHKNIAKNPLLFIN